MQQYATFRSLADTRACLARSLLQLLARVLNLPNGVFTAGADELVIQPNREKGRRPLAYEVGPVLLAGYLENGRSNNRGDAKRVPQLPGDLIDDLKDRVLRILAVLHVSSPCPKLLVAYNVLLYDYGT